MDAVERVRTLMNERVQTGAPDKHADRLTAIAAIIAGHVAAGQSIAMQKGYKPDEISEFMRDHWYAVSLVLKG
jgi:hypothetical protein